MEENDGKYDFQFPFEILRGLAEDSGIRIILSLSILFLKFPRVTRENCRN